MNWLAHLRLAPAEPLLRLGNLAGDFVRGVDLAGLHPQLRRGVEQHRAIDRFVDAHALVRRSRQRLGQPFQRFGGVLADVFYDHFLARDWHLHGDGGTLQRFTDATHAALREHAALLPPRLQQVLPMLEAEDWLGSYASLDGIERILVRMSRRLSRPSPLAQGANELRRYYEGLGQDFVDFWPELEAFAQRLA